jgi:hypothetical protein
LKKIKSPGTISTKMFASRHVLLAALVLSQLATTVSLAQHGPVGKPSGQQQQNNSQTTIGPVAPATPPIIPVQKKSVDGQLLEKIVFQTAEAYAREVVQIIGGAIQIRNSVTSGLTNSMRELGDFREESIYKTSAEYFNGQINGRERGRLDGESLGESTAKTSVNRLAESDINQAVDLAIALPLKQNPESKIVWKPRPRKEIWTGQDPGNSLLPSSIDSELSSSKSKEWVLNQISSQVSHQIPSEIAKQIFDDKMLRLATHNEIGFPGEIPGGLKPGNFFGGTIINVLPSEFQENAAFESWLRNRLNSSPHLFAEALRYYREISDGNIYQSPDENAKAFRRGFSQIYVRKITDYLPKFLSNMNIRGFEAGQSIYKSVAFAFASGMGLNDGYKEVYRKAAVAKYDELLSTPDLYLSYYESFKKGVMTTSRVGSEVVRIVSEDHLDELTIGDTIDAYVDSLVNRGMISSTVTVQPLDNTNLTVMGSGGKVDAPGLTKSVLNQRFQRQWWISDVSAADQIVTAQINVGGKIFRQDFKISFEALIDRVANPRDLSGATSAILMKKATEWIRSQLLDSKNIKGISGDTIKENIQKMEPSILIFRLKNKVAGMNPQQKARVFEFAQSIRDALGNRPSGGGFANPPRRYWEKLQDYLNEMQLPGTTPKDSLM